jgi:hypothetical protein
MENPIEKWSSFPIFQKKFHTIDNINLTVGILSECFAGKANSLKVFVTFFTGTNSPIKVPLTSPSRI